MEIIFIGDIMRNKRRRQFKGLLPTIDDAVKKIFRK